MDSAIMEEVQSIWRIGANSKSESTTKRYTREVERYEEWLAHADNHIDDTPRTLWDATSGDVSRYLRQTFAHPGKAETTFNRARGAINQFYDAILTLENEGYELLADDFEHPREGVEYGWSTGKTKTAEALDAERITYLTDEELTLLVENVPAPRIRNELIVRLMYLTGLRRGELANIKLTPKSHLNRENETIDVPAKKSPLRRKVPYPEEELGFHLDQWLNHGLRDSQKYAGESDYLFPTNDSERIHPDYVNTIVTRAAENAGFQKDAFTYADDPDEPTRTMHKITSKALRHTFAIHSLESKIDVRHLAALMGHRSEDGTLNLDTTMIYTQFVDDDSVEAGRDFVSKLP